MLIFDVFFFLFLIFVCMPCMEYENMKIKVNRVIGNEHFLGLFSEGYIWASLAYASLNDQISSNKCRRA